QSQGNPGNMGVCVACFERDIAGALGLHTAAVVQYLRPEILGFALGSFVISMFTKEFSPRFGSAPLIRFLLGMVAMIGALVFLGCPWRAFLRLAGGDLNAIAGIAGLAAGIYGGTLFFRRGFTLGKTTGRPTFVGFIFPAIMLALLVLRFVFPPIAGEAKSGPLWYSLTGPASQHAPLLLSLGVGLAVGILAQRSRFCTMGALRDIFLFRQFHLFTGLACLVLAAFISNLFFGQVNVGFAGQPIAHTDGLWNFLSMAMAGLAFALAGGCPGRQIFAAGEGNADAAIFVLGMFAGAGVAHNFATASSPAGLAANGALSVCIGFAVCLAIGFLYSKKR
ncbi:MAG: YedE family putative selenium transporter, partial [Candidatus Adiutrix sp.]